MKTKSGVIAAILSAVLFTILFYKQALGLNLLIFEMLYLVWLGMSGIIHFSNRNMVTATAGFAATAIFTVFTHSDFSNIMNFLALMVFVGMLNYPAARSYITSIKLSLINIYATQKKFVTELSGSKPETGRAFRRILIFILPVIIILIFVALYRSSNPVFDGLMTRVLTPVSELFESMFRNIDFLIAGTFLLGLLLSNYLIMRSANQQVVAIDAGAKDGLVRIRSVIFRKLHTTGLKNEYKAGIFLLLVLNVIILVVNAIDIYWVWFNFTWNGQYLKQFVHQGTYMLILSILISIALVLYFFRKNLNFYPVNTFLKYLSYAWLAQNAILTLSVAMRNYWYIYYYALAYKRIGVILFLILTLYGLYSVYVKVRDRRTSFFLFRTNAYVIYVVLIISSLINWDVLIAKYNFEHAGRSYLHYDFIAGLSDKTLQYIDKPAEELKAIDSLQKRNFPNEISSYMNSDEYLITVAKRKLQFKKEWEAKGILSWNYPEYITYKQLFTKQSQH